MGREWSPFRGDLSSVRTSGITCELPTSAWSLLAPSANGFQRMVFYGYAESESAPSIGTTAIPVGRLVTQRIDPKDYPEIYNYDCRVVVRSGESVLLQSYPDKSIDWHHLPQPISDASLRIQR